MTDAEYSAAYPRGLKNTAKFLRLKGATPDNAEDFAQAAWSKVWEKRLQFRGDCSIGTWAIRIAINEYHSWLRKPMSTLTVPLLEHDYPTKDSEDDYVRSIDTTNVLNRCNRYQKMLLIRVYIEGRKVYTEVPEFKTRNHNTIRVIMLRAREQAMKRHKMHILKKRIVLPLNLTQQTVVQ